MDINEDKLRLDGYQIQLKMRPLSNQGTASSRNALLGRNISRPVSAIPLLNLGYNEFEAYKNTSTRRPWSADNPLFEHSPYDGFYTDGTTSADSAEELDKVLPSSHLLDNLLSESLYSWRNGKRTKQSHKNKQLRKPPPKITKHERNDTPSAGSDTSSSAESITRIETTQTPNPTLISNEYEESIKSMALIPGLKTKPPIPKKPDIATPKSSKKASPTTECPNFESIANNMLSYNLSETTDMQQIEQSSTSTLDSTDEVQLKIQNWFQEPKESDEVKISELKTDLSIQNLKSNPIPSKKYNCSDSESGGKNALSKPSKRLNDISNFETKASLKLDKAKRVNFGDIDFSDIKTVYEKRKMKQSCKNFIKENIKQSSKKSRKKLSSSDSDESLSDITKSIRSSPEIGSDEVKSWISNHKSAETKPSYLDCLKNVNELQETCKDINLEGISELNIKQTLSNSKNEGNTYDDIVAILQTLEEEDKKSQIKMESMKKMVNEELSSSETERSDEISNTNLHKFLNDNLKNQNSISPHLQKRDHEQPSRSSINSANNLNDLFLFLDEVDKNCVNISCTKENCTAATPIMETRLNLDTLPKLEELLEHSNLELSNYVIQLNLRLKEKSSSIALLQTELSSLREHIKKISRETSESVKQKLKIQKEDYENAVKRHQKFIDQLITDKKTLNQQCEGLVHEMKVLEDRYNSNLKAIENKHKIELQKVKEMQAAGEKLRRDRWIDIKTQKIKELTVKGLEPEVEKMNSRHQQELMDLRMLHKREIEDLELRSARKLQQHCETLRDQLLAEREKALAQERDLLRQRYEHMVEAEEQGFQDQRRRLLADHANRISECEERENNANIEKDRAIKQAQQDFEDKLQTAMRKHNIEISLLKEKTEMEMETFRNNYKKQIALQLGEKESEIREKYRKDRDTEIEAVIERLEMEASDTKQQIEQSYENRMRRLKEKYEKEICDLEQSEREATTKYSECKMKLVEADDQILTLKGSTKQLETQLVDLKELTTQMSNEREHIKEIIGEEMKQEIETLAKELQELKADKDKELQKVYARVKVAVARKDETILELNRDHIALQEKCAYLENMLEQQRKEYLIK